MDSQERLTRTFNNAEKIPVYFGVDWDLKTINLFNSVVQDILSYKRLVKPGCQLVVVCKEPEFLNRVCNAMQVSCVSTKDSGKDTPIWKLYYEKECPPLPDFADTVYTKRVSMNGVRHQELRPNDPRYPSLYNYRDNVALPPGRNPNINKIPPRMHNGLPNVLQPWF